MYDVRTWGVGVKKNLKFVDIERREERLIISQYFVAFLY